MPETASPLPVYSGFWRRFAALAVDAVLLVALMLAISEAVGWPGLLLREEFAPRLGAFVVSVVYFVGFESSGWQATPGKRAVRIKVTDLSGHRLSIGRAVWRRVAELLSFVPFLTGFAMAAFTRRRQCLHDLMAGTLVVRAGRAPQEIAFSPPARRWPGWRIGLLVGSFLVAGMLGTRYFLPRVEQLYDLPGIGDRRYHSRTEVVAAIYYAGDATDTVESWFNEHREFRGLDIGEVEIDDEATHTISKLSIVEGTVRITFGGESDLALHDHTVTLTPAVDEEGNVAWICGYAEVPEGYVPSRTDYLRLTNVLPDALPAACLPDAAEDSPGAKGPSVRI
ncbi:MAG: hypothetical protein RLZZ200_1132 [Pseudomonadota bacterium]|jgi:uncharacterized RDD family membrane protein YckC